MNGITYFRLKSEYPGDYTKNCALNGNEIDNNFYVLEGRDIKSIEADGKDIVVNLLNGSCVSAEGVLDFVKNAVVQVSFDEEKGILTIIDSDGCEKKIEGFLTRENNYGSKVATDNTIIGNGSNKHPLSIAPTMRTGQYKAVNAIVKDLPKCGQKRGDRFVTSEDVSDYGYLYNYKAVRKIACELKNSGWRIPTKEDWDDLLNAVEPCDCDKTHDKADKNAFLGRWAGKLLKSKTMWKESCCDCDCDCCDCDCCDDCCGCENDCCKHSHDCGCNHECDCDECNKKNECNCKPKFGCDCGTDVCIDYSEDDKCSKTYESEENCKCEHNKCKNHRGLDAYGFRVTPAGYADDGCNISYFKERSAFWTATTDKNNTKAYIKRFHYNKDGVFQDIIASNYHLSLRLVKDYDGSNYYGLEEIMGMEYPTLLLPSATKGKSIWTACNVANGNASLCPMMPNNGFALTYTKHFFINEWDGFRWVRNELRQGDSIVVANAPKGKKMVEYRLIGDELVNVADMVYDDVMDEVHEIIDRLDNKIDAETENRINADNEIKKELHEAEVRIDNAEVRLENAETRISNTEIRIANAETRLDNDEQRIENAETRISNNETRIGNAEVRISNAETRIANTEARLDNDETRINDLEERVANNEVRITNAEARVDNCEQRVEKAEERVDNCEKRVEKTEERLDNDEKRLENAEARLDNDEQRIEKAEERVANAEIRIADAETRLDNDETRIANAEERIGNAEKAIIKEIADRKSEDERIEGKILTQEGTEFDSESGVLTLKSAAGTNDVTVQFSFNFGSF